MMEPEKPKVGDSKKTYELELYQTFGSVNGTYVLFQQTLFNIVLEPEVLKHVNDPTKLFSICTEKLDRLGLSDWGETTTGVCRRLRTLRNLIVHNNFDPLRTQSLQALYTCLVNIVSLENQTNLYNFAFNTQAIPTLVEHLQTMAQVVQNFLNGKAAPKAKEEIPSGLRDLLANLRRDYGTSKLKGRKLIIHQGKHKGCLAKFLRWEGTVCDVEIAGVKVRLAVTKEVEIV
jgi:hypothetical protein